jgi:hypothetical protein
LAAGFGADLSNAAGFCVNFSTTVTLMPEASCFGVSTP